MATHPTKADPIAIINRLYRSGLKTLDKEMAAIAASANEGPLSVSRAKDLRDYLKLLKEMRAAHETIMADRAARAKAQAVEVSDAELAVLVKGQ